MSIITISREFGSGGRELGKRLAAALDYAYYDREIAAAIAQKTQMDEGYVAHALESGLFYNYPIHFGHTFSCAYAHSPLDSNATRLFAEQQNVLQELAAKGNCIIVGRAANTILQDHAPFKLFVYADMPSRVKRCQERAAENETLTDKEMERRIKKIDGERAKYHDLFSNTAWGDKASYHLCVNTTGVEIKALIPALASYIRCWQGDK